MRILFLTTYNVSWKHEHFFTQNVSKGLVDLCHKQGHEVIIATITEREPSSEELQMKDINGNNAPTTAIVVSPDSTRNEKKGALMSFFKSILPDIVHSNMIEGIDIEAARESKLPIVNTIHIGGIICPRGGGNGFLRYDDSICHQRIGKDCSRCMAMDMPFPDITYFLHKVTPHKLKTYLSDRIKKNILYLTPFLKLSTFESEKKRFIETAKYSHLICANKDLINLLCMNGLQEDHLHLMPHGVRERKRLPFPDVNRAVKFYYLGRIQYSKGIHIIMKALKGIPVDQYEFHVIGDASHMGKKALKYYDKLVKMSQGLNVFFEGRVGNEDLETKIRDYHVMIHSAFFHEIYGIAIAEGLSMGRPVLATRCGGAEMQIKENENGWLINPNDVDDMRNAILYIINHRQEIIQFSENAKLPESVEDYSCKLLNLYEEILASSSSS